MFLRPQSKKKYSHKEICINVEALKPALCFFVFFLGKYYKDILQKLCLESTLTTPV